MWRRVTYCFIMVICIVSGVQLQGVNGDVYADDSVSWLDGNISKFGDRPAKSPTEGAEFCSGTMTMVQIVGYSGFKTACVYGAVSVGKNDVKSKRMARFGDESGVFRYAFAYPSDRSFHEMKGFCVGWINCVYSWSQDVMFSMTHTHAGAAYILRIDLFSNRLMYAAGGATHYTITDASGEYVRDDNDEAYRTRAIALSSNGVWLAVELFGRALARIDVEKNVTLSVAYLSTFAVISIGDLAVAVSDDGTWLAMVGRNDEIELVGVVNGCGVRGLQLANGEEWCLWIDVLEGQLFIGYGRAYAPRFISNMQLSLRVIDAFGQRQATLVPGERFGENQNGYVAFGDSYSSGQGEVSDAFYIEGTNTAQNSCHRSSRSYPYLFGVHYGLQTRSFACSGSVINDVRAAVAGALDLTKEAAVVSVGVGGNDIGFAQKLSACVAPGTCDWAKQEKRAQTASEIQQILPRLITLIQQIQVASGSPVLVIGYPEIINPESPTCDKGVGILFTGEEKRYIDETLKYLNDILESAAYFTDAMYVDIENSLVGGRLCDKNRST